MADSSVEKTSDLQLWGKTKKSILQRWGDPRVNTVLFIAAILLVWELGALQSAPHRFPSIIEVTTGMYQIATGQETFSFVSEVSVTIFRTIAAVAIALLIGVPLGIMMGRQELFGNFASVYVLLSMSVPSFVWAFLGVLWFGMTDHLVPVMVGVIVLIPYVVFNTWEGTKQVNENLVEMTEVFQLSTLGVWRHVFIPHLLPYIMSSTRMIIANGWKIMLVAEIFGAQSGVGFVISEYFLTQQNDMILAWSLPVLALVFVFERLLRRLEHRLFGWKSETDEMVAV